MFFNSELVKLFYSWLENTWILLGCHNMFVRDSPNRDFRSTASDDKEIKKWQGVQNFVDQQKNPF